MLYKLYHQRLGHCGQCILSIIHKHIKGIPKLKGNAFYICPSCALAKITQHKLTTHTSSYDDNPNSHSLILPALNPDFLDLISSQHMDDIICGEHFYLDFRFPRGKYIQKDEIGRRFTSIDKYNSYLLIIDHKSSYTWIMLAKSKHPPLEFLKQFFAHHSRKQGRQIITTDKGGELHNSLQFRELVTANGYLLQPTATDAPFQNRLAKHLNQTYSNVMRCMLHAVNLPPEFWYFALIHAVKIKNMLPHVSTGATPHLLYTGNRPTADNLCILGCRIYI